MGAVWARTRSGLRKSLGSSIALVLMIGIASAAVLASAASARRTDSAYPRFREAFGSPDALAIGCAAGIPWAPIPESTSELPQVVDSADLYYRMGYAESPDGDVLFTEGPTLEYGITGLTSPEDANKLGMKVLEGRLADPTKPDEVTIGYLKHPDPSAEVGTTIEFHMMKRGADIAPAMGGEEPPPALFAPPVRLKVVGITVMSGPGNEVRGDAFDIVGTPAFIQKYGSVGPECGGQAYWLKGGLASAPGFISAVQKGSPETVVISSHDEATFVRRNTHPQAVTLWLFAAFVALAGLIIFGQALARQTSLESTENPILRALGMTRSQLFGVAMMRSLAIGLVAALVAVLIAAAVSGVLIGDIAQLVEPDPGIRLDLPILLGGAGFIVVAVMLIAVIPAWRAARVRGDVLGTSITEAGRRPSALARSAAAAGAPPTVVAGMKLALEPGRGRTAIPVRSAVIGLVLASVALVASMTFASSLDHLTDTPELSGITFDTGAGNPFYPTPMRDVVEPLFTEDPGLENVTGGNFSNQVRVIGPGGDQVSVTAWGLEPLKGEQHPPLSEGVWPTSEGQIALGSKTMRAVGANVGETVRVTVGETEADLEVVGQAVFPDFGFGPGLGEGSGMTFDQLKRFFPDEDMNLYLADVVPGADFAKVRERIDPVVVSYGSGPLELSTEVWGTGSQSLQEASRSRSLPELLASVVAMMAVAMLAHTLASSIRRRRRDLAILKTLGFTRRQVSATVAWQASTLVLVSLAIGIPLGVVVGRWAWNTFAEQLGVIPEVVIPGGRVLLLVPVSLLVANLIAFLPGRSAARTRPSIVLRAE